MNTTKEVTAKTTLYTTNVITKPVELYTTKEKTGGMTTLRFETKVNKAKTTGRSLKTTIPMTLIEVLGLENGSTLKWNCEIEKDKVTVCIEPVKEGI